MARRCQAHVSAIRRLPSSSPPQRRSPCPALLRPSRHSRRGISFDSIATAVAHRLRNPASVTYFIARRLCVSVAQSIAGVTLRVDSTDLRSAPLSLIFTLNAISVKKSQRSVIVIFLIIIFNYFLISKKFDVRM